MFIITLYISGLFIREENTIMNLAGFGYALSVLLIYLGIALVWCIVWVIAMWQVFTKAGEAGWKAIIPFYNTYILYKISWNTSIFWMMFGCGVVGAVLGQIDNGIFLSFAAIASFVASITNLLQIHRLSRSFGHGIGFTLGLIFLNPIFILILGFGTSEYRRLPN